VSCVSPFVVVAVVQHPHDDAGGDGHEDEQQQSATDRAHDDGCVAVRERFWTTTTTLEI